MNGLTLMGARRSDADARSSGESGRFDGPSWDSARQLAGVVDGTAASAAAGRHPLFRAASTVAVAAGIALHEPETLGGDAAEALDAIARRSHVRVRRVALDDGWWREASDPLLGFHRETGTPLALLPDRRGGFRWVDPATGQGGAVDRESAAALDSGAWLIHRPLAAEARSGAGLLRFVLRGRRRELAAIVWPALAATLAGLAVPHATALLVDHAVPDARPGLLLQLGAGLLVAAVGATLFRIAQSRAQLRFETGADVATQAAVWDHVLRLPLSFLRNYSSGDLQSRVTAVSRMRARLGGGVLRALFGIAVLVAQFGLLLYYSPSLALVALVVGLAGVAATAVTGWRLLRHTRVLLERRGRYLGLMVQLIQGVPKLRVAAAEERAFGRWADDYRGIAALELRCSTLRDRLQWIQIGISVAGLVALFALASGRPALTTGTILGFLAAYGIFVAAAAGLASTAVDALGVAELYRRVRPLLERAPEVTEAQADPGKLEGGIELESVDFHYGDGNREVVRSLSLEVKPGAFVALVGPSGSGKSTLLKLILGFERAQRGTVRYDGRDLDGLDVEAVRRQIGAVLQDGRIGAGSILDHLAAGTQITQQEAEAACGAVGLLDEIRALPMGFHTMISESGSNFSGGQRQRLMIARALVHEPRILLLDEATSALDNRSQATVTRSLAKLDVTRVVVAHRMSTIRDADTIVVLDEGRIVEQGSFDELMAARGPFYRKVARRQRGGGEPA